MGDRPAAAARPSVLVVDDEATQRETIGRYLRAQGFDVVEAGNGLEALLHVKQTRPAAVVLDITMPQLGGLDALRRVLALDPGVTVVVLSGEDDPELERRARALGASAVLPKPVPLPELLAALDRSSPVRVAPAGRVLVVDDEPAFREMLDEFLARSGYETRIAVDGNDGVRAVSQDSPDVVLLDIEMPGLGGIDALAAIRTVAPDVKVIMISGTDSRELAKRSLAYGAFDYIAKPVDFAYLAKSLETALTMKRLEG